MKELQNYDNDGMEGMPVANAQDVNILMHRDVHFGAKFDVMLDYYINEGKGVNPDFELERIHELARLEKEMKKDLAPLILSGADAEKVGTAKDAYKKLRALFENERHDTKNMRLIADLILSEEVEPIEEIEAILKEKNIIVPALMELLKAEEFYDPLFPGYGFGPALAAKCLGLIGDKRAVISLFEAMHQGDFFDEEVALSALRSIGEPAKEFLIKVLRGKPYNEDNERAAIALIAFKDHEDVSKICLEMLQDAQVRKDIPLSTYLILACEGLKQPADRESFKALSDLPDLSKMLKQDIKAVSASFIEI
jgi:hypothetical protein